MGEICHGYAVLGGQSLLCPHLDLDIRHLSDQR